tara:strand:- start:9501 stop:10493 length:993 start_codon:yes stop_codon:yes gene_type:complete
MADQSKLEQMLEKLVNNDRDGADSLFHEFVIEKSRGIYEKMLEDDLKDLEVDEGSHNKDKKDEKKKKDDKDMKEESDESEESVEEASKEDEEVEEASKDEEVDEASDEETDENMEITPEADPMGGDAADDMIDDMEADGEEGDMEKGDDDEEIEDRVVDLEDALDDLKAEFEKMMADKGGEDDMDDMDDDAADMDMGDEEKEDEAVMPTSELGGEELPVEDMEPAFEGKKSQTEVMREYVNKVATPKGEDNKAKSPVAGANNMGGTASNIAQGGEGDTKGSAQTPKEDNMGNVNVPGNAKAPAYNKANGHGAEKKGSGETGADTKSPIGS